MGGCANLAPRFCGPFQVLPRIEPVAYQLTLPTNIKVHNIFQVYLLQKYVHDVTYVIYWNVISMEP